MFSNTGKKTPGDHTKTNPTHELYTNYLNPPTHPHARPHTTTKTAADSTTAAPEPTATRLPAADSEEAAPSEPDLARAESGVSPRTHHCACLREFL